jgi:hypothetical protein
MTDPTSRVVDDARYPVPSPDARNDQLSVTPVARASGLMQGGVSSFGGGVTSGGDVVWSLSSGGGVGSRSSGRGRCHDSPATG